MEGGCALSFPRVQQTSVLDKLTSFRSYSIQNLIPIRHYTSVNDLKQENQGLVGKVRKEFVKNYANGNFVCRRRKCVLSFSRGSLPPDSSSDPIRSERNTHSALVGTHYQ